MRDKDMFDTIVERAEPRPAHAAPPGPPLPKCLKRAERKLDRLVLRGARSRAVMRQTQRFERKLALELARRGWRE